MTETKFQREYAFRSPGNGAYQVKLVGRDVANTASIVLTGADDFAKVLLEPGDYTAIIEPIGSSELMRQSLDLASDLDGWVQLQDNLFGERSRSRKVETISVLGPSVRFERAPVLPTRIETRARIKTLGPKGEGPRSQQSSELRKFSVGLSVRYNADPNNHWRRGVLPVTLSDDPGGGAALIIRRSKWKNRPTWRLTAAVADDRRWRMRVPLFKGGVQVVLSPVLASGGLDLAVSMAPLRPERAALIASLEQMFLGSARELINASFPKAAKAKNLFQYFLDEERDPWICTAAALLLAQADEVGKDGDTFRRATKKMRFIPDTNVLLAWLYAREGREADVLKQLEALPGVPYFAVSQDIGMELLTGLTLGASSARMRNRASREWTRWASVKRRQVKTGPFLSWEDARTSPSYKLDRASYETIATGEITPGHVTVQQSDTKPLAGETKVPALGRPIVEEDDIWYARFGGMSEAGGFSLKAEFARGPSDWVEVTLIVTAKAKLGPKKADFFLHDSFHPDRVSVAFENGEARHTVLAWGGFTVGVWIASNRVELELDLSQLPDAPTAIREL